MFWKLLLPLGAVLALVAAACGGSAEVGSGTEDDPRVIEVSALDTLAYEPAAIEVAPDGTVYATTDAFGNGRLVIVTP